MVPSERTVTVGVGHGKKAAHHIDAWLRDAPAARPAKHPTATFDSLHLWFFGDAAQRRQPELEPAKRVENFEEVVGGLSMPMRLTTKRGVAFRAVTASNATAASARARRTR